MSYLRKTYKVEFIGVSVVVAGVGYGPGDTFVADPTDRRVRRWVRAGIVTLVDPAAEAAKPVGRRRKGTRTRPVIRTMSTDPADSKTE